MLEAIEQRRLEFWGPVFRAKEQAEISLGKSGIGPSINCETTIGLERFAAHGPQDFDRPTLLIARRVIRDAHTKTRQVRHALPQRNRVLHILGDPGIHHPGGNRVIDIKVAVGQGWRRLVICAPDIGPDHGGARNRDGCRVQGARDITIQGHKDLDIRIRVGIPQAHRDGIGIKTARMADRKRFQPPGIAVGEIDRTRAGFKKTQGTRQVTTVGEILHLPGIVGDLVHHAQAIRRAQANRFAIAVKLPRGVVAGNRVKRVIASGRIDDQGAESRDTRRGENPFQGLGKLVAQAVAREIHFEVVWIVQLDPVAGITVPVFQREPVHRHKLIDPYREVQSIDLYQHRGRVQAAAIRGHHQVFRTHQRVDRHDAQAVGIRLCIDVAHIRKDPHLINALDRPGQVNRLTGADIRRVGGEVKKAHLLGRTPVNLDFGKADLPARIGAHLILQADTDIACTDRLGQDHVVLPEHANGHRHTEDRIMAGIEKPQGRVAHLVTAAGRGKGPHVFDRNQLAQVNFPVAIHRSDGRLGSRDIIPVICKGGGRKAILQTHHVRWLVQRPVGSGRGGWRNELFVKAQLGNGDNVPVVVILVAVFQADPDTLHFQQTRKDHLKGCPQPRVGHDGLVHDLVAPVEDPQGQATQAGRTAICPIHHFHPLNHEGLVQDHLPPTVHSIRRVGEISRISVQAERSGE